MNSTFKELYDAVNNLVDNTPDWQLKELFQTNLKFGDCFDTSPNKALVVHKPKFVTGSDEVVVHTNILAEFHA